MAAEFPNEVLQEPAGLFQMVSQIYLRNDHSIWIRRIPPSRPNMNFPREKRSISAAGNVGLAVCAIDQCGVAGCLADKRS